MDTWFPWLVLSYIHYSFVFWNWGCSSNKKPNCFFPEVIYAQEEDNLNDMFGLVYGPSRIGHRAMAVAVCMVVVVAIGMELASLASEMVASLVVKNR